MYRLSPRMEQHLESDLKRYHELFDGGRCKSWELEELIVRAIRSDTHACHTPFWKETGHDAEADISVRTNGTTHQMQIKSGTIKKDMLTLSGHRLGRFKGNLSDITDYLNNAGANILAIPYVKTDDDSGRHHEYTMCYVDIKNLHGLDATKWETNKSQYRQINQFGVEFSLRPSMSWQIWWYIPMSLVTKGKIIIVN